MTLPGLGVQPRDQPPGRGPRFVLGGPDDHVRTVAEPQLTSVPGRPRPHVGDHRRDAFQGVRPHQVHVGGLRGDLARRVGQPAEVERRGASGRVQPRRVQVEVHELAVVRDVLAVQQVAQHAHDLERAAVPRRRLQCLAGQVRGDDVDGQPAAEHLVDGGELARELRRPHLAHPHRDQQPHPPQQRRDPGCECDRVDAHRVAGRQQEVVVAGFLGRERDAPAVLPARQQGAVRHAEKLVVVVAERGEPGDLTAHVPSISSPARACCGRAGGYDAAHERWPRLRAEPLRHRQP